MYSTEAQSVIDRLSARPTSLDKGRAERALALHFERLGLPRPPIIWVTDAEQGYSAAESAARSAAWSAAWSAAESAAWSAAWSAAESAARSAAWSAAESAARSAAWSAARSAAWSAARSAAESAAWSAAESAARSAAVDKWIGIWLPFVDAHEAGLWVYWVTDRGVIAVARPVMTIVEDRLHNETGPAVHWPAGARYYFWKGTQVPAHVILEPHAITPKAIFGERNAEVRRVMITRYGQDRFMNDAGAKILDRGDDGELLRVQLADDEPIVALRLRCPSTAAVYIIRVPPQQTSFLGAKAWSYDLPSAKDYVLEAQT